MRRAARKTEAPPRRQGHYNDDSTRWWDTDLGRWLDASDDVDSLEVELQDAGATSWWASLLWTLGSQHGTRIYQFVGRAHSSDPRWPTYTVAGPTFPVQAGQRLEHLGDRDAWADEIRSGWRDLDAALRAEGWRSVGRGANWWSATYIRPRALG